MSKKLFKLLHVFLITILLTVLVGCNKDSEIDADENYIQSVVNELTQEKYQGRLTGSEGNRLAIDYVVNEFKEIGLKSPEGLNNYLQQYNQEVRVVHSVPKLSIVDNNGNIIKKYNYIKDFGIITTRYSNLKIKGEVTSRGLDLDNGNNYRSEDYFGKFALMTYDSRNRYHYSYNDFNGWGGIIVEVGLESTLYPYKHFPVAPNITTTTSVDNTNGKMIFMVSSPVYRELKSYSQQGYLIKASMDSSIDSVDTANVIGYIPSNDKDYNDEYIIFTAHLDHVGLNGDGTYNPGGLDNASGIASILEVARIISKNKELSKRNIVFIAFNGEEEGLIGSNYYVNNPIFPLNKSTVINLDMVGSVKDISLDINYCSDSSANLRTEINKYLQKQGFTTMIKSGGGSDHAPFCEVSVPSINLIHFDFDDYHSPSDTGDNVDKYKIEKIVESIINYIYNLQ